LEEEEEEEEEIPPAIEAMNADDAHFFAIQAKPTAEYARETPGHLRPPFPSRPAEPPK
jgi:hypothetical protein